MAEKQIWLCQWIFPGLGSPPAQVGAEPGR